MNFRNWRFLMIVFLIAMSFVSYSIHYFIFRDLHHIFLYLIGDIAFLFAQVLIVTLILQRFLDIREKTALLKKLNMVIGVFFSEAGTELLSILAKMSPDTQTVDLTALTEGNWNKKTFQVMHEQFSRTGFSCSYDRRELLLIRAFLTEKKDFLIRLLENPNLLEHESFTELLWAVFHLAEELGARKDVMLLPDSDVHHLCNDIRRVYAALVKQWLLYMEHLRQDYPFLFSFALRTNPFKTMPIEVKD